MHLFKTFGYLKYLIIALLLLIIGLVLNTINQPANIQIREFNRFQERIFEIDQKMDETKAQLFKIGADSTEQYYSYFEQNDFFDHFGLIFLIYENDSLKYWSNNFLPYDEVKGKPDSLLVLKNGYYVKKSFGNATGTKIISLSLIKFNYPYENEFVKNRFHPYFNINQFFEISKDSNSGFPIYNQDKKYLFSLVTYSSFQDSSLNILISIIYFFSILFSIIFFIHQFQFVRNRILKNWLILLFIVLLLSARYLMLILQIPYIFYSLELFSPHLFATSRMLPSLGDLLLHTFFIFSIVILLYREFEIGKFEKKSKNLFIVIAIQIPVFVFFIIFHHFFKSLIFHSSISFEVYQFFNLSIYSLIGFAIIFLLLLSFGLLINILARVMKSLTTLQESLIIPVVLSAILFTVLIYICKYDIESYTIAFYIVVILFVTIFHFTKKNISHSNLFVTIVIFTLFSEIFIIKHSEKKEFEKMKVLVVNLANERDQVAEMLLSALEDRVEKDTIIHDLMTNYLQNEAAILEYLQMNYFNGYFRKYDLQISVCNPEDDLTLINENSTDIVHCYSFFNEMVESGGINIPGSRFYFLDNLNGRISYLGQFMYNDSSWDTEISLFVSLDSKLISEELGYPELLLDRKINRPSSLDDYSYAKYRNGTLITKAGNYSYQLQLPDEWKSSREFLHFVDKEFEHLVYMGDDDSVIIISKPRLKFIDILATFSYIFVFYYLLITLSLFVSDFSGRIKRFSYDFKNKIKFTIVGILILSLIIVGTGTVLYNIKQFENKHFESISEKLQSVLVEMEQKLGGEPYLNYEYTEYLNYLLTKFSNVFYIDINLYDQSGDLLASSRPLVFEKGLMGKKMNVEAFKELKINRKGKFIHKEEIGNLVYYSAYVPFENDDNQLLAYLNLPYFTRQSALKKETYTLVMAIVNIYFFLILLSTAFAVFISNNITKPLRMIQDRFRNIDLAKPNEPIDYQSTDEIGNLIKEYNRMAVELSSNAEKLAKSERESAWREMAKQIAHEIKNPLTPMKLSVQYLQRAWNDKDGDFDKRLERFSKSMIEQINNLSSIATEFSNFAQMPRAKNENVDIVQKLVNVVVLFEKTENTKIIKDFSENERAIVFADNEQLTIVFTNLLKNAIQSVPKSREGIIRLSLEKGDENLIVSISDNGSGIKEDIKNKLFQPSFTTKSGGMGMGLAIVRSIVDNASGKIWYDTVPGEGSTFYIELPLVH